MNIRKSMDLFQIKDFWEGGRELWGKGGGGGNLEAGKGFVFVAVIIAIIILFSLLMVNSSTQV